ncbi:MAG TPA: BTAD domain-containing putative transcriptional regulator [Acidimicrobiia bacterium]
MDEPTTRDDLLGRSGPIAAVERCLRDVAAGTSRHLVITGDGGSGRTAVLEVACGAAREQGFQVVHGEGVFADRGVDGAVICDVVRPLRDAVDELRDPLRQVLEDVAVLGADRHDARTVGAALVELFAAAGRREPHLVAVDDVDLADAFSARVLAFSARRLHRERVALLMTVRRDSRQGDLEGLPRVLLPPLSAEDAAALLHRSAPGPLRPEVARRLLDIAGGSALALTLLPRVLTSAQRAGAEPLPDPLPVGPRLTASFSRSIHALGTRAAAALVVASAAAPARMDVVMRALQDFDLSVDELTAAERAGIVMLDDGEVRFPEELTRSAAYHRAPPDERRAAHAAIARAFSELGLRAPASLHAAAATLVPDEGVAAELVATAETTRPWYACATASELFERAAELTPDSQCRADRLLAAADRALDVGRRERAAMLVERARVGPPLDIDRRGRAARVRARLASADGRLPEAYAVLDEYRAAATMAASPADAWIHVDAAATAAQLLRGHVALSPPHPAEISRAADGDPARAVAEGLTSTVSGALQPGDTTALADAALALVDGPGRSGTLAPVLLAAARVAAALHPRDPAMAPWRRVLERLAQRAGDEGAVEVVAQALVALADVEVRDGDLENARRHVGLASALAAREDLVDAQRRAYLGIAFVDAAAGELEAARRNLLEVFTLPASYDPLTWIRAVLTLGLVDTFDEARATPAECFTAAARLATGTGLAEVLRTRCELESIEALVAAGRPDEARRTLTRVDAARVTDAAPSLRAWSLRCRALVCENRDERRHLFDAALAAAPDEDTVGTARTLLTWARCSAAEGDDESAAVLARRLAFHSSAAPLPVGRRAARRLVRALEQAGRPGVHAGAEAVPAIAIATAVAEGAPVTTAWGVELGALGPPDEIEVVDVLDDGDDGHDEDRPVEQVGDDADRDDVVTIRLLGHFAVLEGETERTPPPGNGATLLKFLALRSGRAHVEEIVETLWPGTPVDRGRSRLRNVLGRLRQASGPIVERNGDLLMLSASVLVDAERFEREAEDALARTSTDSDAAATAASAALDRFEGDLLPDARYEPWATAPRERLRRYHLALLDLVAEQALAAGHLDAAIAYWQRAIAVEPLEDSRLVRLAEVLADAGRVGAARDALRHARAVVRELGLMDSPDATALGERLGLVGERS